MFWIVMVGSKGYVLDSNGGVEGICSGAASSIAI
jgi:hypothetical protein